MGTKTKSVVLVGISLLLMLGIGYVDEGNYGFNFLSNPKEIAILLIFTVLFSALPLALYNYFLTTRIERYSFVMALTGFLPALILIGWLLGPILSR